MHIYFYVISIMNQNNWNYNKRSNAALEEFLTAVNSTSINNDVSNNDWYKIYLHNKITSSIPESTLIKSNLNYDDDIIIIPDSPQSDIKHNNVEDLENNIRQCKISTSELVNKDENNTDDDVIETVQQILEDFKDDNITENYFENILIKVNITSIYNKLVEESSPELFFNICTHFCENAYIFSIDLFCESFILPFLKKEYSSRFIENSLLLCISKYPQQMCTRIICPLLSSKYHANLSNNVIAELNAKYKMIILKKYLESYENIEEWIFPIFFTLFKAIPQDSLKEYHSIINFLMQCSERHYKSLSFGKLLHCVLQEFRHDQKVRKQLEIIVNENQSPFKNSCITLLKNSVSSDHI